MSIVERYQLVKAQITEAAKQCGRTPEDITVIAVSKSHAIDQVREVFHAGCRDFGESRVQEALEKVDAVPEARWHFIGTLQANKVRRIVGRFALIHSVDTPELARKISFASEDFGVTTSILLQVNTSGEATKHGLDIEGWRRAIDEVLTLPMITIEGFMTMAPYTEDEKVVRDCFQKLRVFRDELQVVTGRRFPELSIGMSNDFKIAIQEGATLLRVGTAIFG